MREWRSRWYVDETSEVLELTPLVDVVFLLLIFFVVSARLLEPQGYRVALPEAATAPEQAGTRRTPVVWILSDGSARWQAGPLPATGPLPRPLHQGTVELRADRRARHGDVIRWMDRLHAAGVTEVVLATTPLEAEGGTP